MTLGELIKYLEARDPETKMVIGFHSPHSFRGYYEQLAFKPATGLTIGNCLDAAKTALGTTYEGYKGGDFTMRESTTVCLACYGKSTECELNEDWLEILETGTVSR